MNKAISVQRFMQNAFSASEFIKLTGETTDQLIFGRRKKNVQTVEFFQNLKCSENRYCKSHLTYLSRCVAFSYTNATQWFLSRLRHQKTTQTMDGRSLHSRFMRMLRSNMEKVIKRDV